MMRRILLLMFVALAAFGVTAVVATASGGGDGKGHGDGNAASKVKHIVVIYEENHSFDNLYGSWEGVNGRAERARPRRSRSARLGVPFTCLLQNDVNFTVPPLSSPLCDATDKFANAPFDIGSVLPPTAQTCPQPGVFAPNGLLPNPANLPGGCTRDLVHRFYQEQYQLNDGAAEPLRDRERRGRPHDGVLRHPAAPDLPRTCTRRAIRTTRSPTTSSRRRSAARSSTTSG